MLRSPDSGGGPAPRAASASTAETTSTAARQPAARAGALNSPSSPCLPLSPATSFLLSAHPPTLDQPLGLVRSVPPALRDKRAERREEKVRGMRRVSMVAGVVLRLRLGGVSSASAKDHTIIARDILPSGQYDVPRPRRRPQAQMYNALTPLFDHVTNERPLHRLQVREARASTTDGPDHHGDRPVPRRHDPPRPLRRPAHLRHDPRRRSLGGRLDRRRGPRAAAAAGALRLPRRRHRRPRAERDRADRRPPELRAQRPDGGAWSPSRPRRCKRTARRARPCCATSTPTSRASTPTWRQQLAQRTVDPQRHLRRQRAQGPVPRPGRRPRGAQLRVPERAAAAARQGQGLRGVQRPAPVQEPEERHLGQRDASRTAHPEEAPRAASSSTTTASRRLPRCRRASPASSMPSRDPGQQRADGHRCSLHHRSPDPGRRPADRATSSRDWSARWTCTHRTSIGAAPPPRRSRATC